MAEPVKQYDPTWPFPQFDAAGNRLLPEPDTRSRDEQLLDEVGEAKW